MMLVDIIQFATVFETFCSLLQEAELARDKINGYKFDRAHKFAVNMFNDFDRYMKVSNEWTRPESKPYTPGVIISLTLLLSLFLSLCELLA